MSGPRFGAKWPPRGSPKSSNISKNRFPEGCQKPPSKTHEKCSLLGCPRTSKSEFFIVSVTRYWNSGVPEKDSKHDSKMPPIWHAFGTTNDTKGLPEGVPKFTQKACPQKFENRVKMGVSIPSGNFKNPPKIKPWAQTVPHGRPRVVPGLNKPPKSCHQA